MLDILEKPEEVQSHHELCPFEITMPNDPLQGYMHAEVLEGNTPSNGVIRVDQELTIRVHWWLEGSMKRCICGFWCLQLYAESIGPGPEFVFPSNEEKLIPLDACGDGHYRHDIKIPAGYIDPKHCSAPYKLLVGLTYRTTCQDKNGHYEPGPMAGFCKLGHFQFYDSVK